MRPAGETLACSDGFTARGPMRVGGTLGEVLF